MKVVAVLLIAAAGLMPIGCGKAAAAPDLDSFLTGLPATLISAESPVQLRAALNAAPPEVSQTESTTSENRPVLQLRFPSRDAHWLVTAWGLDRVYAVATDPHQNSWQLVRYRQELADPNGARIAVGPITVGNWTVRPQLAGRPGGALPDVVAGASPACAITDHAAQVVGIDIDM